MNVDKNLPLLNVYEWEEKNEARNKGVLFSSRISDYTTNNPSYEAQYETLFEYITSNNVSSIGLDIQEDSWNYPIWAILRYEKHHEIFMEHLNVSNPSQKFSKHNFIPEIIISERKIFNNSSIIDEKHYDLDLKTRDISILAPRRFWS
ncbi:MAG: hypothetical protein AB2L10_03205 [Methanospirillum sp.]